MTCYGTDQRRRGSQFGRSSQPAHKTGREARCGIFTEASRVESTSVADDRGIGAVVLNVQAGFTPGRAENGRNALYELAHQILQTRDLSDAAT